MNNRGLVTCRCGWVSMGVTLDYAQSAVKEFNDYYQTQPAEVQAHFGGPATLKQYLGCWCGASFRDGRPFTEGDCPDGCTIGPMLHFDEVYNEETSKKA